MHKGDDFQQNLLEKAYFITKMFGSAIGPTGQFWLLESALNFSSSNVMPSPEDGCPVNCDVKCSTFLITLDHVLIVPWKIMLNTWPKCIESIIVRVVRGPRTYKQIHTRRNGTFSCLKWKITHKGALYMVLAIRFTFIVEKSWGKMYFHSKMAWPPAT